MGQKYVYKTRSTLFVPLKGTKKGREQRLAKKGSGVGGSLFRTNEKEKEKVKRGRYDIGAAKRITKPRSRGGISKSETVVSSPRNAVRRRNGRKLGRKATTNPLTYYLPRVKGRERAKRKKKNCANRCDNRED